jgi:flagellar basal-body rod protein FlgB
MAFEDLPLLGMLKNRMRWLETRQKVLAENVANAETPGYRARDLKKPVFAEMMTASSGAGDAVGMAVTSPMHMAATGLSEAQFGARRAPSFETTPDGNSVVMEDEMMKVAETQQDYQVASLLYTKSLSLLKMAVQGRF